MASDDHLPIQWRSSSRQPRVCAAPPQAARSLRLVLAVCACLTLTGCGGDGSKSNTPSSRPPVVGGSPSTARAVSSRQPNIVFVLTDDLSMNLLRFMPHVLAMERGGLTFTNYFVSDSLCCPSRASIFSGNFPHDTHVFGNFGPTGGFQAFYRRGKSDTPSPLPCSEPATGPE
jgi:N-acetylglucosamine-6-sulfatase